MDNLSCSFTPIFLLTASLLQVWYVFFVEIVGICYLLWKSNFIFWNRKSKQRSKDLSVLNNFYTHTHLYFTCSGLQYEPVKVSFEIISINLILLLNLLQSCQILLFIDHKIIFNCLWVEKQNNLWWYLEKRYLEIVYFN